MSLVAAKGLEDVGVVGEIAEGPSSAGGPRQAAIEIRHGRGQGNGFGAADSNLAPARVGEGGDEIFGVLA